MRHYFVDEAGDLTLFSRHGEEIVGKPGCSEYFIIGLTHIADPPTLRRKLIALRSRLCSDPYFSGVPSLHPSERKTALAFHAKDDLAEIRREVYSLLFQEDIKVYAMVRRKRHILGWVRRKNREGSTWRYVETQLYDATVRRLFKDRLHQDQASVVFAQRGKRARNEALQAALERAAENFAQTMGLPKNIRCRATSTQPHVEPCLQAVDYYLWALQRLYERHEDRFFKTVSHQFVRVIDFDDKREKSYGVYYDERNKLTVDKIKRSLAS